MVESPVLPARGDRTSPTTPARPASGALSLVVGLAMLFWPTPSLGLVAVTCTATGLAQIVLAIADPDTTRHRRALACVLGALSFLAGVLSVCAPDHQAALVAVLIASWLLVTGVLALAEAANTPLRRRRALTTAAGAACLVAGLVLVVWPDISPAALTAALGIDLVVLGALTLPAR